MNGSVFSKARYMIGVGFEILARTTVPQLPPSYPPPPRAKLLGNLKYSFNERSSLVLNPDTEVIAMCYL